MSKPNCYKCKFRCEIPGNSHSRCMNGHADVLGDGYGISRGWFLWPFNFDPTWLASCDGFEPKDDTTT